MADLADVVKGIKKEEEPKLKQDILWDLPTFDGLMHNDTFMRALSKVLDRKVFKTDSIATMMVVCQMEILQELRKLNTNLESQSESRIARAIKK